MHKLETLYRGQFAGIKEETKHFWCVFLPIAEFILLHASCGIRKMMESEFQEVYCFWLIILIAREPRSAKIYSIYKDNIDTKDAPMSLF